MDIAGHIQVNQDGKGGHTDFNVLLPEDAPTLLLRFLDRYLGRWNRVTPFLSAPDALPSGVSMQVIVPNVDNTFPAAQCAQAEQLFARDDAEARVYEFDRFHRMLVALTLADVTVRRKIP